MQAKSQIVSVNTINRIYIISMKIVMRIKIMMSIKILKSMERLHVDILIMLIIFELDLDSCYLSHWVWA